MNIRPMRLDDIPRVVEIAGASNNAPHWRPEAYARALDPGSAPARITLVAHGPEAVVFGFLVAALIPPKAELESVVVAPTAQRQGIARRLCLELFDILKKHHIAEVALEVRESNQAARALYASLGFMDTGRRKGYYTHPPEDGILLDLALR